MKPTFRHILQSHLHNMLADVSVAAYSENGPGWSAESVKPEFYCFIFIECGSAWLKIGEKDYSAEPGQMFILPAGVAQSHGTAGEEPFGRYWCHFRAELGDMQLLKILNLPVWITVDSCDREYVKELFQKMETALKKRTLTSGLRLKAALLELLSYYLDRTDLQKEPIGETDSFEKLDEVLAYVEEHLDRAIHVKELAGIAFLHPNYFIEFFKSAVGCSPIQYINQRRLEKAKELLGQTDEHISEIAKRIGMQNHYLSRMFKTYTGLSPSRYRNLYRSTYSPSYRRDVPQALDALSGEQQEGGK